MKPISRLLVGICLAIALSAVAGNTLASATGNPSLTGQSFYNDPVSNQAATQAALWRNSRPADAAQIDKIANQPQAYWIGDWTTNSVQAVKSYVTRAEISGKIGMIVLYNIPRRDCGGNSSGGASSYEAYKTWIDGVATGIASHMVIVILEPDALDQLDCLSLTDQQSRLEVLGYAVGKLKSTTRALVYVDAGNTGWLTPTLAAQRLQQANVAASDGFSLNVSNFYTTAESTKYGIDISNRVGGKHFVIDTSRNGRGSNGMWCNPAGRGLGHIPTSVTPSALVDAYLWVKGPGESDGNCNGGPSAGTWWADYALGLALRSAPDLAPSALPKVPAAARLPPISRPTATLPSTQPAPVLKITPAMQPRPTKPVSPAGRIAIIICGLLLAIVIIDRPIRSKLRLIGTSVYLKLQELFTRHWPIK